jgi:enterochelin esterase-like enzyme
MGLICCACCAGTALGQLRGRVEQHTFTGPLTGRSVSYNIYLPEGYSTSTARYPVIYHVHGIGGNQGGQQNTTVPASFETALAQGVIGPVIVVFPNGSTNSWWADSIGSAKPADTDVARQLIPHVDATYRTIPTRGARIIEGFSMGGFGATKFYSKYPELFAACVEYDGAIVTWPVMLQFHAADATEIFGNSETYFNQFSPWSWCSANAATLRAGAPIRMVAGALVGGNRQFRDFLTGLSIPVQYVETGCAHDIVCLFNAQGAASAAFIASHLNLACVADVDDGSGTGTHDGGVGIEDLLYYLGGFDLGVARADVDDGSGMGHPDGGVGIEDLLYYLSRFDAGC